MKDLREALDGAASEGVISSAQVAPLERYLRAKLEVGTVENDPSAIIDTESPRFVRGFHDILITIGAAILLMGIVGTATILALLPAVIVLGEILVVRQRLALPAVLLSIAMLVWSVFASRFLHGGGFDPDKSRLLMAVQALPVPVFMLLFYARYRVPVALAFAVLTGFTVVFFAVVGVLEAMLGLENPLDEQVWLMVSLYLVAALTLFAVAMRYDMSDPRRVSRRSDIAFWLHLASAPALLYGALAVVFLLYRGDSAFEHFSLRSTLFMPKLPVVLLITALMLIGLIIDRRAFVTSGLVSMLIIAYAVFRSASLNTDSVIYLALLTVGAVVLTIGIGWQGLRRLLVGRLPPALQQRLPPVH
ncbi:multidrug transporter EmrE-like cation transporter [Agrobacterium vitis]|nr:multidrug transporter EmrE-like cation transporter [Agrobacterium vitis]MBE1439537.1 multidrug transporter EmrE-like cation transporter [Agrobacterium vitis]